MPSSTMTSVSIAFDLTEQKFLRQPFTPNILQAGSLGIDLKAKSNVLDTVCALHTWSAPSRRQSWSSSQQCSRSAMLISLPARKGDLASQNCSRVCRQIKMLHSITFFGKLQPNCLLELQPYIIMLQCNAAMHRVLFFAYHDDGMWAMLCTGAWMEC